MTSPAPWRLYLNDEIIAADDICVARKHRDVHEENGTEARWRADAALICAAPEMLALLRRLTLPLMPGVHGEAVVAAKALLARLGTDGA